MTEIEPPIESSTDDRVIVSKVIAIVVVFVLISVLFAAQIYFYGAIHEGVRAYIRGEGLWAKAQKEATFQLTAYSYTRDATNYEKFIKSMSIPLGDHAARLALSQTPPDLAAAHAGFLEGGNDAQDIDGMISLYQNFKNIHLMREAIEVWESADQELENLFQLGKALNDEITAAQPRESEITRLRQKIAAVSAVLHLLEQKFSSVLSETARWVRRISWQISFFMSAVLIGLGVLASRRIIRSISNELAIRKMLEEQIFKEAREDPLTGLYNRKYFTEQFDRYLKLAAREKRHCSLLYLDLDYFKPVNDTFGHTVGDTVLKAAAEIFKDQIRSTDLIARIGGDEFVILLVHPCDRDGVEISAKRIIDELQKPMLIDGNEVQTGVSIGAAMFPEDGEDAATLVKKADDALYAAKEAGRRSLVFWQNQGGQP